LCVRETPLSQVHLRAALRAAEAGAMVMPASPSFYSHPATMDALLDTVVGRVLDRLGLENELMERWGEDPDPFRRPAAGERAARVNQSLPPRATAIDSPALRASDEQAGMAAPIPLRRNRGEES
ncbi:MAG TPA: flavoprotein, partial [Vulgatibacter sp.]